MGLRRAKELYSDVFDKAYPAKHRVLLLWRSPLFNELEHRSAAFEDYTEARLYADGLKEAYMNNGYPFVLYTDREIYWKTKEDVYLCG